VKKIFYLFLILVIGISLAGCGKKVVVEKEEERVIGEVEEEKEKVTLVLDFGEEKVSSFRGIEVEKGATVFDLLTQVTGDEEIELGMKKFDFGYQVIKIGEKENGDSLFWVYSVNGEMAEVAADQQEVFDGDIIRWEYQKMN